MRIAIDTEELYYRLRVERRWRAENAESFLHAG